MSCPDANELAQLADGTLSSEARRSVERHFDGCAACSELVVELAWLVASDVEGPPGFRIVGRSGDYGYAAIADAGEIVELRRVGAGHDWLATLVGVDIPNLVPVLATVRTPKDFWIATPQTSHAAAIDASGVRVIVQAASALHRRGIAIAALSPANLRRDEAGVLRLDPVCVPEAPLRYLAPECLRGGPPTPVADQFALCAVLWEAIVGHPPFAQRTAGALVVAMQVPPTLPADRDARLLRVLIRGMAIAPTDRWRDLDALAAALDARSPRSLAWIVVLVVLLAAFVIGLAVW